MSGQNTTKCLFLHIIRVKDTIIQPHALQTAVQIYGLVQKIAMVLVLVNWSFGPVGPTPLI